MVPKRKADGVQVLFELLADVLYTTKSACQMTPLLHMLHSEETTQGVCSAPLPPSQSHIYAQIKLDFIFLVRRMNRKVGRWERDGILQLRKTGEKESVSWIRWVTEALNPPQL